ncbi:MAG: hypothetical protein LBE09_07095 [Christensenellaceae bacterium]|jgi:hypothetical protein|nr:hypothetical protein [Christensenellaceae bacterium]
MKKFGILTILVAIILSLTACQAQAISKYGVNIIKGGTLSTFDYNEDDGGTALYQLQENWTLVTDGSAATAFSIIDNDDAASYLKITTTTTGYAYAAQKLYLKSSSYYKVQYDYTTATMSNYDENKSYLGLYVGFLEDPDFNIKDEKPTIEDKSKSTGDTATFYFKTEYVKEATIAINVGTPDNPVNTSNVTIKNFTVTRVTADEALDAAETLGLYTLRSTVYGEASELNLVYVILGAIGTLIIAYAFYMIRARSLSFDAAGVGHPVYNKIQSKKGLGIAIAICTALLIRLIIILVSAFVAGSETVKTVYLGYDMANNAAYSIFLAKHGPLYFLQSYPDAALLPGATYLLAGSGLIGRVISLIPGITELQHIVAVATIIKLFAAIADVGILVLIYKLVAKHQGKVAATCAACFYACLPIVFLISSSVGSLESIMLFFATASFYCAINKNYIGMAAFYFVACIITPAALLAMPFILMYTVFVMYLSIKERTKMWIAPIVAIILGLGVYYAITSPIYLDTIRDGNSFVAYNAFIAIIKGANVYSANAFNFQGLIGNNFKPVSTESTFVTIFFILFILVVLGVAYFKTKNRLSMTMLSGAFALLYWFFCNSSTPTSILMAVPLMFIYMTMVKDKRLFALFSLLVSLIFINASYLYLVAGYNVNGVTQILYDTPIVYIMGSLFLVWIIAFIIVLYDAMGARKAKPHFVLRVPYFQYARSVSKNIVISIKNFGYTTQSVFKIIFSKKDDKPEKKKDS